jgi:hypothetical protein
MLGDMSDDFDHEADALEHLCEAEDGWICPRCGHLNWSLFMRCSECRQVVPGMAEALAEYETGR